MPSKDERQHGKRSTYTRGCRCDQCKRANTVYQLAKRQRDRGLEPTTEQIKGEVLRLVTMPADQEPDDGERGPVEAGVLAELGLMTSAAQHPGLVASAIALAQLLGDKRLATTWPSAQRQLRATLDSLWSLSATKVGRLEKVAAMASRGVG